MLPLLFPRLTADPARGAELFAWVTRQARESEWYVAGEVPDTLDGRFAALATIAALVMVRLERDGDGGNLASVALTERFVEAMEAEHREMGLGDPKLGRTVRKLVSSLARRVDLWRAAVAADDWSDAARKSVYNDGQPPRDALAHSAAALRALWVRLDRTRAADLAEGRIE